MNARHLPAAVSLPAAVCLCACVLLSGAVCADSAVYDMDGDRSLTVYDYILKKREALDLPGGTAAQEAKRIGEHLSGRASLPLREGAPAYLLEAPETPHPGFCTGYIGDMSSGRCGIAPVAEGILPCAISNEDYRAGMLAGAYLHVTAENGKTTDVLVTDTSAGASGHLDLHISAFEQLAPRDVGRLNITWQIIPYPAEGAVRFRFTPQSSRYYAGFYVLDHVYPIWSVERLCADGTWAEVRRRSDNVFILSGAGEGPFTFRLTDIYGRSFVEENIPLCDGETVTGTQNFPADLSDG